VVSVKKIDPPAVDAKVRLPVEPIVRGIAVL
jgi:hypothetical protein